MAKTKIMYIWLLLITFIRYSFSYGSNIFPLFESFKEEASIFFSNLLSYDGLIENGDKINSSIEVWRETLSGTRCANSAECKNKKKGKFTFTNYNENDPIIKEYINTELQIKSLNEFKESINVLNLQDTEKEKLRTDTENLISIMTEGSREYSNRRSLAGVDIIDSKYIVYEGVSTDKNGTISTSYFVAINSCNNDGGTLQTFTQNIYYCNNKRVSKAGYDIYVKNTDNYCTNTPTTRTGCWCRKDRQGNTCSEYVEITCNLKVTNPDFTKPCRDKSYDSDFYTYSIPGYDPCHWIDKNQVIDVTYNIKCFHSNYTNMKEHWGINFEGANSPTVTYTYQYNDANKKIVLSTFSPYSIEFRIANWKWFTKYITFSDTITTFGKLTGDENGVVKVDFSKIEGENSGDYKIGGRVHMYAVMPKTYWFNINSYGYFFEVKGWSEPLPKLDVVFIVVVVLVSFGIIAFAALVIFCYCKRRYNYKKMMKSAEEQ